MVDHADIIKAIQESERRTTAKLEAIKLELDLIRDGFPGGDTERHRRYHESVIEWRETRTRMVREALVHAGKLGFWAACAWIAYAVWIAVKMELMK